MLVEVDFRSASAREATEWIAFDELLCAESPRIPFEQSRLHLARVPDFMGVRLFVARDADGALIGEARTVTRRSGPPQDTLQVYLTVHPDRRRRGIGRALLQRAVEVADAEGLTQLSGRTRDSVPAGEGFARHLGAEPTQRGDVIRLAIEDIDWSVVRAWKTAGLSNAPTYEPFFVDGPCPDDLIERVLALHRELYSSLQSPQLGGGSLTVPQLRAIEGAPGPRYLRWTLYVRHTPTGALVGMTEIGYHPDEPETLHQSGTVVEPAHRGRGLAKWMKAAMMERIAAERPGVEEILTANAAPNAPIVAINRALGFRPWIATTSWRLPVARVRAYLARGDVGGTPRGKEVSRNE